MGKKFYVQTRIDKEIFEIDKVYKRGEIIYINFIFRDREYDRAIKISEKLGVPVVEIGERLLKIDNINLIDYVWIEAGKSYYDEIYKFTTHYKEKWSR